MGKSQSKINRGSEWRKWDLHVHTPFSHTSEYSGNTDEEKWENFIGNIETLPSDIKVLGINDYLFLDGYKKVLDYKKKGRLKNIEKLLPVIEFRLKEFVGHNKFKKINYHIIFAEDKLLSANIIENQFLISLRASCNLDRDDANACSWAGVITRDSLKDLGEIICNSGSSGKRKNQNYYKVGFDNISFSLKKINEYLGEVGGKNSYLEGKYVKAIGRAEWSKFTKHGSLAEKKDIINNTHFIFSASPTVGHIEKHIDSLSSEKVNSRLLHCSDAHKFTDNKKKSRPKELGHCFTWIKGEPGFETLRQAAVDYKKRVVIQERHPLENKNASPELFIDKVEYKLNNSLKVIHFNKNINSIIGRRGAGKSVLLKHIAFNTRGESENPPLHPITKLKDLKVHWCNNSFANKKRQNGTNFVEYIPQNYLSAITYEDGKNYDKRDEMLRSHLFGNELFKNINEKKEKIINKIEIKISERIKETLSLHKEIEDNAKQLEPLGRSKDKEEAIKRKKEEINKFGKVNITEQDIENQTKYALKVDLISKEIKALEQDIEIIKNINNLKNLNFIMLDDETFSGLSTTTIGLIKSHIKNTSFQNIKEYLDELLKDLNKKKEERVKDGKIASKILKPITQKLKKNKTIREILEEISVLEEEKSEIEVFKKSIKDSVERREKLINEMAELYLSFNERIKVVIKALEETFDELTFITFDFRTSYSIAEYENDFFHMFIDGRSGDQLKKFIDENRDFNKAEILKIIESIILDSSDIKLKSTNNHKERALSALLCCRYDIDFTKSVKYRQGEKLISFKDMTGGQKAMALLDLIFSLSKSKYPILIDQPENDIDASGISNDLKKLILEQKKKRQIIMATHNPNLLLLTDSENIIVAKNNNDNIEYHNGGIENELIQKNIIDILEGGDEAFNKRMAKLKHNKQNES